MKGNRSVVPFCQWTLSKQSKSAVLKGEAEIFIAMVVTECKCKVGLISSWTVR